MTEASMTTVCPPNATLHNTTRANSTPVVRYAWPTPVREINIYMTALFAVIFIAGQGNSVLAIRTMLGRVFRDRITRIIVFNLCLANALLVFTVPFLISVIVAHHWVCGHALCKIYWVAEQSNKYTSIIYLTFLCCDRYIVVVTPQKAPSLRRPRRITCLCAVCWIAALTAISPIVYYSGLKHGTCGIQWPTPDLLDHHPSGTTDQPRPAHNSAGPTTLEEFYTILNFILLFVIPAATITLLYGRVLRKLHYLSRRLSSYHGNARRANRSCTRRPSPVVHCDHLRISPQASLTSIALTTGQGSHGHCPRRAPAGSRYRKTVIVVLLITTCHIVLWAPFWICHLVFTFLIPQQTGSHARLQIAMKVIHILPYVNSALFPYFYLLVDREPNPPAARRNLALADMRRQNGETIV